jgi:phenylpropionate dioxygenase-like ring-hydroxylating dioxygenase large terminal subunit
LIQAAARHDTERAIQRRLVHHIANGRTTDMADAPMRIPVHLYTDPERLAAERRELFQKLPLCAGFSCEIPNPGDTLVFDGAGPSIIVARQADGSVAAFRNLCTHRGARLLRGSCHAQAITCPFHGWSFGVDGRLLAQPGSAGFAGLEASRLGLLRVPCAERHGMLFVRAEVGEEELPIDEFLGSLGPELASLNLHEMALVKDEPLFTKGNWKYVLDTYGEGYHFAALHPDTLGTTHYSNVAAYDAFDRHFRIVFPQKIYGKLKGVPESDWPQIDAVVYLLFPNTAMIVGSPQPGLMLIQNFRLFPETIDRTRADLAVYAPRAALSEQTRPMFEAGWDLAARIVSSEDYLMSAEAFDNLRWAPSGFHTVFGRNEIALQHLQRNIAEAIGMPIG